MNACPQCKRIIEEGKVCPVCNIELSDKFSGTFVLMDPNNSEIGKILGKETVGKYALKVR
ncbi:DNA-directed RNA polymerase subunit E'' [Candidatus Micrarchaeota archaeon]|nr:DNA-directed RNA polymerase subunit E'' [Candidatus Micrarchaeota archaeon]